MTEKSSSHVRKVAPPRPRLFKNASTNNFYNFIENNINSIQTVNKKKLELSEKENLKDFKFINSNNIIKTKSGLVIKDKKKIEKEFKELKLTDEKLMRNVRKLDKQVLEMEIKKLLLSRV